LKEIEEEKENIKSRKKGDEDYEDVGKGNENDNGCRIF